MVEGQELAHGQGALESLGLPQSENLAATEQGLFQEFVDTVNENPGTVATILGVAAVTGLAIATRGRWKTIAGGLFRAGRSGVDDVLRAGDDVAARVGIRQAKGGVSGTAEESLLGVGKKADEALGTGSKTVDEVSVVVSKTGDEVGGTAGKVGDEVGGTAGKVVDESVAGSAESTGQSGLNMLRKATNSGQLNPDVGAYIPANRVTQRELLTKGGRVRHLGNELPEAKDPLSESAKRLRRILGSS